MLSLYALARVLNQKLGDDFFLQDGNNLVVDNDKIDGVLQADRTPFFLSDINAETMSLTISFELPIQNVPKRNKYINAFSAILGCQEFIVDCSVIDSTAPKGVKGSVYHCISNLYLKEPTTPSNSAGSITAVYEIGGTLLAKMIKNDGAEVRNPRISNEVQVFVGLTAADTDKAENRLISLNSTVKCAVTATAPNYLNSIVPEPSVTAATTVYQITCLDLGRVIDETLLNAIEIPESNKYFYLARKHADGTLIGSVRKVMLLSDSSISEIAGAFRQYTLGFEIVAEVASSDGAEGV